MSGLDSADSGFAVPELYELCKKESVYYIIRLKANPKLKALAEELHSTHEICDVTVTETYVKESIYQASSCSKPRLISIQWTRPAGKLFFSHIFL